MDMSMPSIDRLLLSIVFRLIVGGNQIVIYPAKERIRSHGDSIVKSIEKIVSELRKLR